MADFEAPKFGWGRSFDQSGIIRFVDVLADFFPKYPKTNRPIRPTCSSFWYFRVGRVSRKVFMS